MGHAFEARIYAENPRNSFLPDVGPLLHLSTPSPDANLRLEEGFKQGANIEVYYDPMISKLVARGRNRTEALRVLRKGLEEFKIVGVSTNVEFLRSLAGHRAFIQGDVETGFIAVRSCLHWRHSVWISISSGPETSRRTIPRHPRDVARSIRSGRLVRGSA